MADQEHIDAAKASIMRTVTKIEAIRVLHAELDPELNSLLIDLREAKDAITAMEIRFLDFDDLSDMIDPNYVPGLPAPDEVQYAEYEDYTEPEPEPVYIPKPQPKIQPQQKKQSQARAPHRTVTVQTPQKPAKQEPLDPFAAGAPQQSTNVSPDLFGGAEEISDIAYVPFYAEEFDIQANDREASMFVSCLDDSIVEWDIGGVIVEAPFKLLGFTFTGVMDSDGSAVNVAWDKSSKFLTTSVPASHGIGALSEAAQLKGYFISKIRTNVTPAGIFEDGTATDPGQAIGMIPPMDVSLATITLLFEGLQYTLHFVSGAADFEVSWLQSNSMSADGLARFLQDLAMRLPAYASQLQGEPVLSIQRATRAGFFHDHKNEYHLELSAARRANALILDLSSIQVRQDGEVHIRRFSS